MISMTAINTGLASADPPQRRCTVRPTSKASQVRMSGVTGASNSAPPICARASITGPSDLLQLCDGGTFRLRRLLHSETAVHRLHDEARGCHAEECRDPEGAHHRQPLGAQ